MKTDANSNGGIGGGVPGPRHSSFLKKIRGLWRFDGDEEPVHVSRRTFLFMAGVVAAGALVPSACCVDTESTAGDAAVLFKERYRHLIPALYDHGRMSIDACLDGRFGKTAVVTRGPLLPVGIRRSA